MPRVRSDPNPEPRRTARSQRDHNRRVLSQNFLRNPSAIGLYLSKVVVEPDELVLEIGAGDGEITERIAPRCRELHAYEIDPFHATKLVERLRGHSNVSVIVGDFLTSKPPREGFAVVGNVPFSITSKVVDWCLDAKTLSGATIITQVEYAKKRTGDFGRWSLRTIETWPWYSWEFCGRIPKQAFSPVPRVDAGVLHLVRRNQPLLPSTKRSDYYRLVELGFGGLGGSLYNSLARQYPKGRVTAAFREAGIGRETVVAFVTPDQWLAVFRSLIP